TWPLPPPDILMSMPPPRPLALLPVTELLLSVAVTGPLLTSPKPSLPLVLPARAIPPPVGAVFPETVTLFIVRFSGPLPSVWYLAEMPPPVTLEPPAPAVLPLIVVSLIETEKVPEPRLRRAPKPRVPRAMPPPSLRPDRAMFPLMVSPVNLAVSEPEAPGCKMPSSRTPPPGPSKKEVVLLVLPLMLVDTSLPVTVKAAEPLSSLWSSATRPPPPPPEELFVPRAFVRVVTAEPEPVLVTAANRPPPRKPAVFALTAPEKGAPVSVREAVPEPALVTLLNRPPPSKEATLASRIVPTGRLTEADPEPVVGTRL